MRVLLVYLGARPPRYLWDSLTHLIRIARGYEVWLASDDERTLSRAESIGIRPWRSAPNAGDSAFLHDVVPYSTQFRDGFWVKSLGRFWVLRDFMRAHPRSSVLHVEADVWVSPEFPFSKLDDLPGDIAFPMINEHEGIASLLYLRNTVAADVLIGTAVEMHRKGERFTDMTLLGALGGRDASVCILPTSPSPEHFFQANIPADTRQRMSRHAPQLGGIVDAATWGQYWLGLDPRNHAGKIRLFVKLASHSLDPSISTLNLTPAGGVTVSNGRDAWPLYAVHVHSKDRRAFRDMPARLRDRTEKRRAGADTETDWTVWIAYWSSVALAIFRRVLHRLAKGLTA